MDKKSPTVVPVIILFEPELNVLSDLLLSLNQQVNQVCVVDNSSSSIDLYSFNTDLKLDYEINYNFLDENVGIAKAQNLGIKAAKNLGATHVLLLDQDSVLPSNMVSGLLACESNLLADGKHVATVGPLFRDVKDNEVSGISTIGILKIDNGKYLPEDTIVLSDYIISSGSLIRIEVIDKVGFMLERLFIDWVDIEWGLRANRLGFNSYVTRDVIIEHSIGDEKITFLGKKISLHSDFRNYFIVRNAVYLLRSNSFPTRFKYIMFLKVPWYILVFSIYSKNSFWSLKLLFRAVFDGFCSNMGLGFFRENR